MESREEHSTGAEDRADVSRGTTRKQNPGGTATLGESSDRGAMFPVIRTMKPFIFTLFHNYDPVIFAVVPFFRGKKSCRNYDSRSGIPGRPLHDVDSACGWKAVRLVKA